MGLGRAERQPAPRRIPPRGLPFESEAESLEGPEVDQIACQGLTAPVRAAVLRRHAQAIGHRPGRAPRLRASVVLRVQKPRPPLNGAPRQHQRGRGAGIEDEPHDVALDLGAHGRQAVDESELFRV